MNNFKYYTPTEIIFGKEAVNGIADLVKKYGGSKVLIHYGGGSAVRSGLISEVSRSLDEAGIPHVELGGVVPNPRLSLVYEGIDLCRAEGVDMIIAVGGGSVIDSSKAIAYGAADPDQGDVWDFYEHSRKPSATIPVGAVLTIAAAGSEMSDSSVITNDDGQLKRGCNSDICRLKFAVMDPEYTKTLPWYQTACGCTDIIMHTLERYFTTKGTMELTDAIAGGLIRTVMDNAVVLRDDPDNYDARAEVMWASSLSHNGLTGCGNGGNDFMTHKMEHEVSGIYDVAHGAGLAALWGSWARYVMDNCMDRFVKFAVDVMDVDADIIKGNGYEWTTGDANRDRELAMAGVTKMEEFFRSIDMPTSLTELGLELTDEDINLLARKCYVACGEKPMGAAMQLSEDDFINIYNAAK